MLRRHISSLALVGFLAAGQPLRAIILFGAGDPEANTTEPGGALANSGWDTQTAAPPSATAVGPRHFVSASHLGTAVAVGAAVPFAGLRYQVIRSLTVPGTGDLRFLEVAGRLPPDRIAEIYTGTGEPGRPAVIHGIGRSRGAPVIFEAPGGPELRGWQWGANGGRLRWGTNVVTGITTFAWYGPLLVTHFTGDAGADEATVANGDSGGGLFILDQDGRWKLAGVTMDVEASFRLEATGPDLTAAIFDRRGLYGYTLQGQLVKIPENDPVPGSFAWLTRVSPSAQRIAAEIARPAGNDWPRLLSSASATGEFTEHPVYAVDPGARSIQLPVDGEQRFFQLPEGWTVTSLEAAGTTVTLHY